MTQRANTLPEKTVNDEVTMAFGKVLRVLTDPTRLRIYLLLRQGESCVCELAATLNIAENLVSHHLRTLKRIQFVSSRRDPSDAAGSTIKEMSQRCGIPQPGYPLFSSQPLSALVRLHMNLQHLFCRNDVYPSQKYRQIFHEAMKQWLLACHTISSFPPKHIVARNL